MQVFSLNNLAEQFEVDRSTMVRAMRGVPADEVRSGNRPAWKIGTAAKALEVHRRKRGDDVSNSSVLIDRIEADFETLDKGFAQLLAEPDLERRRKLDKTLGVGEMIGALDVRMRETHAVIGEAKGLSAIVGNHLIGDLISRYATLLDYWPTDLAR
jgi:hypothetical protein